MILTHHGIDSLRRGARYELLYDVTEFEIGSRWTNDSYDWPYVVHHEEIKRMTCQYFSLEIGATYKLESNYQMGYIESYPGGSERNTGSPAWQKEYILTAGYGTLTIAFRREDNGNIQASDLNSIWLKIYKKL